MERSMIEVSHEDDNDHSEVSHVDHDDDNDHSEVRPVHVHDDDADHSDQGEGGNIDEEF